MMEYISHSGYDVMVGHFPGNTKRINAELIGELKERKFTMPINLGILSVITKDQIGNSPLHYQLTKNGYNYINPVKDRNMVWDPAKKMHLVLEGLKTSQDEYTLVLDGNDVSILTDLTDIIPRFESYDKKVLYNATIWRYPDVFVDEVKNRRQYGRYCFLNAGCCIGKTPDLIDFYEYCVKVYTKSKERMGSEQYYVRKAFDLRQNDVFFDYDCRIFQCWHLQKYAFEGDRILLK